MFLTPMHACIHKYEYIYIYVCVYICIYIYIYSFVCMWFCLLCTCMSIDGYNAWISYSVYVCASPV